MRSHIQVHSTAINEETLKKYTPMQYPLHKDFYFGGGRAEILVREMGLANTVFLSLIGNEALKRRFTEGIEHCSPKKRILSALADVDRCRPV